MNAAIKANENEQKKKCNKREGHIAYTQIRSDQLMQYALCNVHSARAESENGSSNCDEYIDCCVIAYHRWEDKNNNDDDS